MKDYEAYIFDWDGTLGRTLELWLQVYRIQYDRYGIHDLSDNKIVMGFGRLVHAHEDFGIPVSKLEQFMEDIQKEVSQKVLAVDLYEGAAGVLNDLKKDGKKLALVTTNWREAVYVMLSNNGLSNIFDTIVCGDDVKTHKPDPEGVLMALDRLKVSKDKAVMLGDSDKDLGAAKNAGIDSILFYPTSHKLFYKLDELKAHEPTYLINDWNQLRDELAS